MRLSYIFLFSVTLSHVASRWKSLNHKNSHEILTREILYPRNIHEENVCTRSVPTRKSYGPTKFLREEILDPTKYVKNFWTHELPTKVRRYDISRPTRPTMARDLRNLADSQKYLYVKYFFQVSWKSIENLKAHNTLIQNCREMCFDRNTYRWNTSSSNLFFCKCNTSWENVSKSSRQNA